MNEEWSQHVKHLKTTRWCFWTQFPTRTLKPTLTWCYFHTAKQDWTALVVCVNWCLDKVCKPWAISSWRRASPRAENRSSLMRVSALRLYSRCWAFSCMADRVDSSMSVSFSTQRYFPRAWVREHIHSETECETPPAVTSHSSQRLGSLSICCKLFFFCFFFNSGHFLFSNLGLGLFWKFSFHSLREPTRHRQNTTHMTTMTHRSCT